MNQREIKGHGFFRKSKAYGLVCGIALAGSLMMSNTASADEVVETTPAIVLTDNPATNLPEAQPETPEANRTLSDQAGTQTGEMRAEISSTELNTAVSEAKEAGVSVSTEASSTYDNLESAKSDLAKQEVAVKEATAKQEVNTKAIDKAVAENKKIDQDNKAELARVEQLNKEGEAAVAKKNAEGQKAVDEANKAGQAAVAKRNADGQKAVDEANAEAKAIIDAENARLKAEYDKKQEAYEAGITSNKALEATNAENQAYNRRVMTEKGLIYTGDYATDQATVAVYNRDHQGSVTEENKGLWDKALAGAYPHLPDDGTGYTPSGSSTMLNPVTLPTSVSAVGTGVLEQGKTGVVLRGDVDPSKVVKEVYWGNSRPEGGDLRETYYGDPNSGWGFIYDYSVGNPSQILIGKTNTWYRIPNLITTMDDSVHDGYVMFQTDTSGLHPYYQGAREVAFWNANGAINAVNGGTETGTVNQASDAIRTVISLDRPDNTDSAVTWIALMADIDGGQFIEKAGTMKVLGVGGGLSTTSDTTNPSSSEDLGFTYGLNRSSNALNGYDSSPDGTILFVQNGMYDVTLRNTAGGNSSATARADFGAGSAVDKTIIREVKGDSLTLKPISDLPPLEEPKEPDYKPFQPEVFKPETFRPAPFVPDEYKPVEPNITPNVPVPPKETYKVAVHPVFVSQKPSNDKGVANSDLVSVDGKLVAKGELVAWELTNANLKAGRETITAYTMSDPLPAGFNMDKELTAKNNPDWLVASDEVGNTIISATKTLLNVLNKDLSKAITIPKFLVYGCPVNDGATYENTFKTTITTPKGSYTVTSDTPVIYTPGNNPNTPRNKGGEDPTPNDNLIKPEKDVVDDKGNSINGKSVLPNTKLNYVAKQDFDQYKGMTASKEAIGKGFAYIDDYLDVALDGKSLTVNAIKAANGDDVRELLEMHHVLSMETIDAKLAEMVKNAGISPVGEFYMWVAKDPQAFYEAYIQKGLDITYNLSFEINKDFKEGDITNQTFQIDFGNGYYGNVVTNTLPVLSVKKNVVKDGYSLDGKEVALGDEVVYILTGWVIPANRGYDVSEYRFVDKLQTSHDAYKAFEVVAYVDITLADGTVLKTGTDLAKYADQVYNAKTGLFELKFQEDFLSQIPRTSEFGASTYITVQRIKAGEVTNEFQLFVNDNEVISNKVVTTTPEPPKPEKPQVPAEPEKPTPEKVLPKTGEAGSLLAFAGAFLGSLGLAGLKRKQ